MLQAVHSIPLRKPRGDRASQEQQHPPPATSLSVPDIICSYPSQGTRQRGGPRHCCFVWPGLAVAEISGLSSYPPILVYLQLVLATTMASTSYRRCTCRSDTRTSSRYCMFSSLSDSSSYTYYYYMFLYAISGIM